MFVLMVFVTTLAWRATERHVRVDRCIHSAGSKAERIVLVVVVTILTLRATEGHVRMDRCLHSAGSKVE